MSRSYPDLDRYIQSVKDEFEQKLAQIVEIPTVSMEPERRSDIERGADLAVEYLRAEGVEAEKAQTNGYPCVIGQKIIDPRFTTVTIYNHIDVQPADPSEWNKAPFTFFKDG